MELYLSDCGTRFVTSPDRKTAYLIPSNKPLYYEITCNEKEKSSCNLVRIHKNCQTGNFPINWIGSEYIAEVPTIVKELEFPTCYAETTLFGNPAQD